MNDAWEITNSTQEKWDRRFLEVAKLVSTWSKDPSTKCGAVLVKDRRIVGTGYNGFPRGIADKAGLYLDRDKKYPRIVHAELNAILHAGLSASEATIYVYPSFSIPPLCNECAKSVIQAGISAVVGFTPTLAAYEAGLRWKEQLELARNMIYEAGLEIREWEEHPMAETINRVIKANA